MRKRPQFYFTAKAIDRFRFSALLILDNFEKGAAMGSEFFVGWGTLALINAGLAQIKNNASGKKNFGGSAWFIISCFLGPIATLLIVAFKD